MKSKDLLPYRKQLIKTVSEKLSGYARKGRIFFKSVDDTIVKLVEVQFLRTGEGEESFTIHVGVHAPIIVEVVWGVTDSIKNLSHGGCVLHFNIGEIIDSFSSKSRVKYWDLGTNEPMYLSEVSNVLEHTLCPFLETINSLETLDDVINATPYAKHEGATALMVVALKKILKRKNDLDSFVQDLYKARCLAMEHIHKFLEKN